MTKKSDKKQHEAKQHLKDLKAAEKLVLRLRKKLDLPPPALPVIQSAREFLLFHAPGECPFCHSQDISAGDWDGGPFDTTCKVECSNCGSTWTEIYHLKGGTDFVEGRGPEEEETDDEEESSAETIEPVAKSVATSGPPVGGEETEKGPKSSRYRGARPGADSGVQGTP